MSAKAFANLSQNELYTIKAMRWKARTDLQYLANEVLGYPDVQHPLHTPIFNILQQFPTPDKEQFWKNDELKAGKWQYKPITPLYDLPGTRRVLIIDPRSFLKTTINAISHTIQWIINYPDITILVTQANLDRAEAILSEIKSKFQFNPRFRALFPEHCPQSKKPADWWTKGEFDTEARSLEKKGLKEKTVMAASIERGMAGYHFDVMKFSDIVDDENSKSETGLMMVKKKFGDMENLVVRPDSWIDVEGTRYDFCLVGETPITMSDWSEKPIADIKVGDEVVGWDFVNNRRMLKKSKILAIGSKIAQVNKYTFASGRSIIATEDHKFWRGKQWKKNNKNKEYSPIKNLKSVRRLMIPEEKNESWASGWLAGFYDGEGSFRQNPKNPSGTITITQTMHNPGLIEKTREALILLGFIWSETWHKPSKKGKVYWKDRCVFNITGGWKERYRFLKVIAPFRKDKIVNSLFGQLTTDEDRIVTVEPVGERTVYFFACETGNYIADGTCSKNSDCYGETIMEFEKNYREKNPGKKYWKVHVRGAYELERNGKAPTYDMEELDFELLKDPGAITETNPKGLVAVWPRWNHEALERYREQHGDISFACHKLNNPVAVDDVSKIVFPINKDYPKKITRYNFKKHVRVAYYTTTVDTAEEQKSTSDYTAIVTVAWGADGRAYVCDIRHDRMMPDEIIRQMFLVYAKFRPVRMKIEATSYVKGLFAGINRIQDLGRPVMKDIESDFDPKKMFQPVNFRLPLEFCPRENTISKKHRIKDTLQPWYKSGDLVFLDDLPWTMLTKELNRFPKFQHDDILDALSDQFADKPWFGREIERAKPNREQAYQDAMDRFLGIEPADWNNLYDDTLPLPR